MRVGRVQNWLLKKLVGHVMAISCFAKSIPLNVCDAHDAPLAKKLHGEIQVARNV
jgi:hypothetical protein